MKLHIPLTLALLFTCAAAHAQKNLVEDRDQAKGWYVPVNGSVTANGGDAKGVHVQLYKDNDMVSEFTSKQGQFKVELDLNNVYTILLSLDGYASKMIRVDTHVPDDLVKYPAYICYADLEPADQFTHSDPFYLDFPSALVTWHPDRKGFYHNTGYLADIQSKVAMLQAQINP